MPKFPRSLFEFGRMFSMEEECLEYMMGVRWPEGFVCPGCSARKSYWLSTRMKVVKCAKCREQISLTAGTVMEKTRTDLCKWFLGAYFMTTFTPGISAVQFQRQAGIPSYECAFQILHKLRSSTVNPEREKLSGTVEVDETYIGSYEPGKVGRPTEEKALVVGAVEVWRGKAGKARLRKVERADKRSLHRFIRDSIIPAGGLVKTDGWVSYRGLEDYGYGHQVVQQKGAEDPAKVLPHVHRIFSNLKAWLVGTHHGVSAKHIQAYLNEFVFRFNSRLNTMESFNTLLGLAVHTDGPTYGELYRAGKRGGWMHPNPPKGVAT